MATKNVNKSATYANRVTNTSNTNNTTSTTTVDSVNGNSPIGISHSEHDDSIMNEVNSSPGNSQVNPEKSAPKVNSAKPELESTKIYYRNLGKVLQRKSSYRILEKFRNEHLLP